jgi:hypothetical protein
MRIRQALIAAAAAVGTAAIVFAGVGPAHAGVAGTPLPASGSEATHAHIDIPDLDETTTLAQVLAIVNKNVQDPIALPDVLAVVTDTGKPVTDQEIDTLVTGKDVNGIGVIKLRRYPADDLTLGDLFDWQAGHTATKKVVVWSGNVGGVVHVSITVEGSCGLRGCHIGLGVDIGWGRH